MLLIRYVEEKISENYYDQEMRCPTHLSIGQECVAATLGTLLRKSDLVVSTHRGHAHYLAKGGNLDAMITELYGKERGCSRGRGGSMHLVDENAGFLGSTAIVGNSIPVGLGIALTRKLEKLDDLACIFIGEAAIETGSFYECANIAATKKYPVFFACENNLYSVYTSLDKRQPIDRKIHNLVEAIGIKSFSCDGNDPEQCFKITKQAIKYIRKTSKPCFVEYSTYRWKEHCGPNFDNDIGYRTIDEFLLWKSHDPIKKLELELIKDKKFIKKIQNYKNSIQEEIDEIFKSAKNAPFPNEKEAYVDEYANFLKF